MRQRLPPSPCLTPCAPPWAMHVLGPLRLQLAVQSLHLSAQCRAGVAFLTQRSFHLLDIRAHFWGALLEGRARLCQLGA